MNTPPTETSPTTCNLATWMPEQRCIEEYHTDNDPMPDGDRNPKHWNDTLAADGKALSARHPDVTWDHAAWNAIVVNGAHHLDERTAEAIELPDHEHILGAEIGESGFQLRPLGAGLTRLLLLEKARAASPGQRVALQVEVLVDGRDTGITDEHVGIVRRERFSDNRIRDIVS